MTAAGSGDTRVRKTQARRLTAETRRPQRIAKGKVVAEKEDRSDGWDE